MFSHKMEDNTHNWWGIGIYPTTFEWFHPFDGQDFFLRPPSLLGALRLGDNNPVAGSIQYAKCSQAADAASIRREIGTQVDRVDHAIHVLLTAGMSTPALRDIAHRVDIEHAAFAEFTGAVFLLGPFATMAVTLSFVDLFYGRCLWQRVVLAVMSLLSRLILFVWLSWSHWDEQRFILKVMNKFLCLAMLGWLGLMFCFLVFGLSLDNVFLTWLLITDLCLLSMLLFAFLGVRGIAKLPCGFRILQICFSRGSNACNARTVSCWFVDVTLYLLFFFSILIYAFERVAVAPGYPKYCIWLWGANSITWITSCGLRPDFFRIYFNNLQYLKYKRHTHSSTRTLVSHRISGHAPKTEKIKTYVSRCIWNSI